MATMWMMSEFVRRVVVLHHLWFKCHFLCCGGVIWVTLRRLCWKVN